MRDAYFLLILCSAYERLFAKLYFGFLQMIACRTFAKLFGDNMLNGVTSVTVQSVEFHI